MTYSKGMELEKTNGNKNSIYKKQCCKKPSPSFASQNSINQLQQSSKLSRKFPERLDVSWSRSKTSLNKQNLNKNSIKKDPKSKIVSFCLDIKNWFGESKNPNKKISTIEPSMIQNFPQCKHISPHNGFSNNLQASKGRYNNIPKSPCRTYQHNYYPNSRQK